MARPSNNLKLNERELIELQTIVRSTKVENRIKERSLIILDWHEGKSYDETQALRKVSRRTVAKWRRRFLEHRLKGLVDDPRSGKPKVITKEEKDKAIHLHLEGLKSGKGRSYWNQQRIGKQIEISQSKVNKILQNHYSEFHKVDYWCGNSTDPEFESKVLNLAGLYIDPFESAIVVCSDPNPKSLTTTYKYHGVDNLISSLAVQQGAVAETKEDNNAENLLNFLKRIKGKYGGKKLHIIAGNFSVNKNESVMKWVAKNKQIELHYAPTYSSWLSQVEIWFNILSKDVLKGAVWYSKKQLVDQLMEYIKTYNKERAKPFYWTYKPW